MNLEGLNVVISANINEFNNSMNSVSNQIGGLGGRFAGFATVAGTAIAGIVTALGALATATATVGVAFNATEEQSMVAWTTLLGGAKEARGMMDQINQFAKMTPFDVENVDMMAKYMHNAGLEGEALFDQLMRNSDVASAFAISGAEAKEFTRQMSQVQQSGVAMTEDLNVLQDRGIPIFKELGKVMGVPVADVKKLASESKITSEVYMQAFNNIAKEVQGASDAQSKTFNGMISAMGDNLSMLAGLLAKPLFEKLKGGMEAVMPVVEALIAYLKGDMGDAVSILASAFGAETTSKIMNFANAIKTGFTTVKTWIDTGKKALEGIFKLFSGDIGGGASLLRSLGLEPAQVMAIVSAVSNIKETISGFVNGVKKFFSGLFSGEGNIGASFVRIFNVIKGVAIPILQDAVEFIKGILDKIKTFWNENGAQIIQAVQNMWSIIAGIFEFMAPVILFVVETVWGMIKGVINGAINIIMGVIKIFAGLFTGDLGKMWEGVKQLFVGAVEFIWNIISLKFVAGIWNAIKGFGTKTIAWVKDFATKFKEFFVNLWDDIWKGVQKWVDDIKTLWSILRGYGDTIFQAMKQIIKNIWDDIVNGVKTAVTAMKDFVVGIWNGLKATGTGIFNGIKTVILGIWNGLKTAVTSVTTGLRDAVVGAWNALRSSGSNIFNGIKDAIMAIFNGLKTGVTGIWNGLKSTAESIFNGIKTAITKPIEGAKNIVMGIIDTIKGAFSKMNITIPKPKLPKISVAMKKGVMGIPYPDFDVSWHKDGGIFTGASVVGLGEAGPEAIVPLQGHRMKPFAETIAKMMPAGSGNGGGSGLTVHVAQLVVREEADVRKVAEQLHGLQQRETRQGGRG